MIEPPVELVELQDWFSLGIMNSRRDVSLFDNEEVSKYITASSRMSPKERYDVYVKDYWPRCLQSLKDDFPCSVRYWGDDKFFRYMTAYLKAYPSRSFTLFHLGQDVYTYFSSTYFESDRDFILSSFEYDWAKMHASFTQNYPPVDPQGLDLDRISQQVFHFQPHVSLLALPHDFYGWSENDFSDDVPHNKKVYYLVYRKNYVVVSTISEDIFSMLSTLKNEKTLDKTIDRLADDFSEDVFQNVFQMCIKENILYLDGL